MTSLIILDLDGTLYEFDGDYRLGFTASKFSREVKNRACDFLSKKLSVTNELAEKIYEAVKSEFDGQISLGLEYRLGIDRYEYFGNTWNLDPKDFIEKKDILPLLKSLDGIVVILTCAAGVWARAVLDYLNLSEYVSNLYTGESNIRKPDPLAFRRICDNFSVSPRDSVSVGDQLTTDIFPAKSLGMKTVLVRGYSSEADYCINRLEELPEAIKRLYQK